MGSSWCNGVCDWIGGQCVGNSVSCGNGSTAQSCDECPSGKSGCGNTDCAWHTNTNLCRDAFSDDVRTASVHLNYPSPSPISKPAWWFQRVIPLASAPATYFATNGHSFGYGGIQEVSDTEGRVIFSLWDQGGCDTDVNPNCNPNDLAQTIACGKGVTCKGFGGEGTGRQSYYDRGPFELNKSYYFVTQAAYLGNRRMEYTGYFYEDGKWRLLSRIQVSTNAGEKWWLKGLYSFVEQWTEIETTSNREALFGPSYMASTDGNVFHQIEEAYFTHGTIENHEHVNAWEQNGAVGIATGGDTEPVAQEYDTFTYPDAAPYEELTSFQGYIGCLNEANNKNEIESCLNTPVSPTCTGLEKEKCKQTDGCTFVASPKKIKSCKNKRPSPPDPDCSPFSSSKSECKSLTDSMGNKACKFRKIANPNLGCRPEN